jgi:hypothetical protein
MWNLCDICSFIGSNFIHQHIYHMSNVFSMYNICVKNVRTYAWMNFTWFSLLIRHVLNLWLVCCTLLPLPIKFFTFKYIANVEICTNQKMATPKILTKIIVKDTNYNSSTSKSKNTTNFFWKHKIWFHI